MIADILTVMWKERKGLLRHQGSLRTTVFTLFTPVVMLGIFLPWQEGREWVSSPLPLMVSGLIPALLVGMRIPDSFAGERERHTLATLLASRLPDRAILLGKVAMAVCWGWGVTLAVLLLGLVTVNVAHWEGRVLLYSLTIGLAGVGLGLLAALFVAGLGVLISLRSATVQGAAQTLIFAVLAGPMVLSMILGSFILAGPDGRERLGKLLVKLVVTLGSTQSMIIITAVLVLIDLGLLAAAMARFRRARLILD